MWFWLFLFLPALLVKNARFQSNFMESTEVTEKLIYELQNLETHTHVIRAGKNYSLECQGVYPNSLIHKVKWLALSRQLKVVHYEKGQTNVSVDEGRIAFGTLYSLSFAPVISNDSDQYICIINDRHVPEIILELIVEDVPDSPGRPIATTVSARCANISWTPPMENHNSDVIYYIIYPNVLPLDVMSYTQKKEEHPNNLLGIEGNWTAGEEIKTPTNVTNWQIKGLQPFTVYTFEVVAINAFGSSEKSGASYYIITSRALPAGKAIFMVATNMSSTSIYINWHPPSLEQLYGEFTGYVISYQIRDRFNDTPNVVHQGPHARQHTLRFLQVFTEYRITLQVKNPNGFGPPAIALVTTDQGIPSKPNNFSVVNHTSTSIFLRWREPERINGILGGYRIYYVANNFTAVRTYKIDRPPPPKIDYNATLDSNRSNVLRHREVEKPMVDFNLTDLQPNTSYSILVKAFTGRFEGNASNDVFADTDIAGPGPPEITNLTCTQSNDSVIIQWKRPKVFYFSIEFYFIHLNVLNGPKFDDIEIETHKDHLDTSYTLSDIEEDSEFKVQITAATFSDTTKKLIYGTPSSEVYFAMKPCLDKLHGKGFTIDLRVGMIMGLIIGGCVLIATVIVFFIWRKCIKRRHLFTDSRPVAVPNNFLEWNSPPSKNEGGEYKGPIPMVDFSKHCAKLHADGDIGFSKEYDSIQAIIDNYTAQHSNHPDNRMKNRYLNIVAYDHTRVHLLPLAEMKKMDYINANYIDGFQMYKAYIGTQGPLPTTFDGFWRMVWEQHVTIIVMITNLVERGRGSCIMPAEGNAETDQVQRKCDMYWPKEGAETYGIIQVRLIKEETRAMLTIRTMSIRHLKITDQESLDAEKTIYQYHYTNWPDHGTPDHPTPVLNFVKKSAEVNPAGSPMIVHCSAGVGRTGTYIVLDAMLKQIKVRKEVNVYGFLRYIRKHRNFLVQTEEQYIFIHDALLEAIVAGDTNISREQIPKYVQTLQSDVKRITENGESKKPLEELFQMVVAFKIKDETTVSALKIFNQLKNRAKVVPVESMRVHLTPKPGDEGSDYINATWIPGYTSLREFIITQHPTRKTMQDFWQMVWDHNTQNIVLLGELETDIFEIFWPTEDAPIEGDTYKVRFNDEHPYPKYVIRNFTMQSLQDDYELPIRMVHSPNWPHHCPTIPDYFYLLDSVKQNIFDYQNGPLLVVDRYGGAEAGTFCNLITLKQQLMKENHADVYMYAKLCHNRRPGIWAHPHQLLAMYLAVQSLCTTPDNALVSEEIYIWPTLSGCKDINKAGGSGHGKTNRTSCESIEIDHGPSDVDDANRSISSSVEIHHRPSCSGIEIHHRPDCRAVESHIDIIPPPPPPPPAVRIDPPPEPEEIPLLYRGESHNFVHTT